jgi:hypothetical protein
MEITKIISRACDKHSELSALLTILAVLAIGALAKFDAAAFPLFHGAH